MKSPVWSTVPPEAPPRVRIGISSCLLGEAVRYDGGHKRDPFLTDVFGRYVEWVPVCPEVEMGMSIPRESIRLEDNGDGLRLIAPASGTDHTDAMKQWTAMRLGGLATQGLCGYILKRNSPSCGLERVKIYGKGNLSNRKGMGIFAEGLVARFNNLPVEEEGRLNDPRLRENFISAVFCYKRWMDEVAPKPTRAALTHFHARHKYLLMAHSQSGAQELGVIAAAGGDYFPRFCAVMRRTPTRKNHTNALHHMAGYFSDQLDAADRAELTELIDGYRREIVPLIVPVTLIRHYVRKHQVAYLQDQVYLNPHPHELMLLNQL